MQSQSPQLLPPQEVTTPPTTPPDDAPNDVGMPVPDPLKDASWTTHLPKTDHVRFFLDTKWESTPLGPLSSWSAQLRNFASFVLADSKPSCLWWGPNEHLIAIYNEQYALLASTVHPMLMGSKFQTGYPDLWEGIKTYFDQARETGIGVNYSSSVPLIVERKGWREETFFSGSFVPVGLPVQGYINSTYVCSRK